MAYANKSYTRIFSLRDQLQNLKKASKIRYGILTRDFKRTGPEYREILASIRSRDSSLSFEELFHKLTYYELFLKHQDLEKSSSIITAAVTQKMNIPPQSNRNNRHFNNQQWKPPVTQQSSNNSQQNWMSNLRPSVCCQLCQKLGHTADVCYSESHSHFEAKANFASGLGFWILVRLIMSPLIRTILKSIQAMRAYPWVTAF
ncbi:hypothetical protein KY289_027329 [Solanum tuberosum]|nr:hypothetical protein KY289_027329 [Solanum tuberosum]